MKGKKKFYKLTTADIKDPADTGYMQEEISQNLNNQVSGQQNNNNLGNDLNTMILSQQEFKQRERALSHLSALQAQAPLAATGGPLPKPAFDALSPAVMTEEEGQGNESNSEEQKLEEEEELQNNTIVEEEIKPIDDVYDVNSVKPQYVLQCLRKNWILDYTSIMEMQD